MPAHHYSALPAHESAGGDDALDADDDKDDPEPLLDFQQFEIEEHVEPQPIFPSTRFWSMVLFFLANTICYLDRTNISIGVIAMAAEYGWSASLHGSGDEKGRMATYHPPRIGVRMYLKWCQG